MLQRWVGSLTLSSLLLACSTETEPSPSVSGAQSALEESSISTQADSLVSDSVELSTHFAIGQGLEAAAEQLKDFLHDELPCAEIARTRTTLSIVYGAKPGACSFHGHQVTGQHTIQVMRSADNEVSVHHEWTDLRDGKLAIDGSADVMWSRTARSRHVLHDINYEVLSGRYQGRTGSGHGDRTQTAIEGGIRVDGVRRWDGPLGHFELDIDDVELRFIDPVPQSGKYRVTTPAGETLTLLFSRIDTDSIRVGVDGGEHAFSFVVSADGQVER